MSKDASPILDDILVVFDTKYMEGDPELEEDYRWTGLAGRHQRCCAEDKSAEHGSLCV